jgi:Fur family ferric uptake transcriptional regulator
LISLAGESPWESDYFPGQDLLLAVANDGASTDYGRYLIKRFDPRTRHLNIEAVLEPDGPAAQWVATVVPGEPVTAIGLRECDVDCGVRYVGTFRPTLDKVQNQINDVIMPEREPTDSADLLRRNGVQVTAQRLAVLKAVSGQPHGTTEEIEELVRAEIGAVSRQAVYDALGILTDKGLIRRIQPARSPARYEDRVDDNHHHLVCRSCGVTVDVPCAVGYTPCLEAANDNGFIVDEAEVIYWGTCPVCRKAAKRRTRQRPEQSVT